MYTRLQNRLKLLNQSVSAKGNMEDSAITNIETIQRSGCTKFDYEAQLGASHFPSGAQFLGAG